MSNMTERNAVREEFFVRHHHGFRTLAAVRAAVKDAMADEIVRLRADNAALRAEIDRLLDILAALREPSEGVLRTVFIATFGDNPVHKEACLVATQNAIRSAVAAAEQEVS